MAATNINKNKCGVCASRKYFSQRHKFISKHLPFTVRLLIYICAARQESVSNSAPFLASFVFMPNYMETRTFVQLGFTFEYFIPGVLLIIIGGVSFFANIFVATSILVFGISLLLLRTGIEIDANKKRVRKFYELFSFRFGIWVITANYIKVELSQTNESQTMMSRGGQRTYETKTYDIVFVNKSGFRRELNDFQNYNTAIQTLQIISKALTIESKNKVADIRHAAIQRRKDRSCKK